MYYNPWWPVIQYMLVLLTAVLFMVTVLNLPDIASFVVEHWRGAGDRALKRAQADEARARADVERARAEAIRQMSGAAQRGNIGPLLVELYRLSQAGAIDPYPVQQWRYGLPDPPQPGQPWVVSRPTHMTQTAVNALVALVDLGHDALARRDW